MFLFATTPKLTLGFNSLLLKKISMGYACRASYWPLTTI